MAEGQRGKTKNPQRLSCGLEILTIPLAALPRQARRCKNNALPEKAGKAGKAAKAAYAERCGMRNHGGTSKITLV